LTDELPTARSTLAARYVRVMVFCKSCWHRANVSRDDVPLTQLPFRCARCGKKGRAA
jgi:hypothetical protein